MTGHVLSYSIPKMLKKNHPQLFCFEQKARKCISYFLFLRNDSLKKRKKCVLTYASLKPEALTNLSKPQYLKQAYKIHMY